VENMKAMLYRKEMQPNAARRRMLRLVNRDRARRRLKALLRSEKERSRACWGVPRRLDEMGDGSMV
jgi:hypothetical protein